MAMRMAMTCMQPSLVTRGLANVVGYFTVTRGTRDAQKQAAEKVICMHPEDGGAHSADAGVPWTSHS